MRFRLNWRNVWLIWQREVRDQFRDRRMLFLIFVLPLLLYPLMGATFLQLAQFVQETPTTVLVLGRKHLPPEPPLFDLRQRTFHPQWFDRPEDAPLLRVQFLEDTVPVRRLDSRTLEQLVRRRLRTGQVQAALVFSPGGNADSGAEATAPARRFPRPQLLYYSAKRGSQVAHRRLWAVLRNYRTGVVRHYFRQNGLSERLLEPFQLNEQDLADQPLRQAAVWSAVFPFMLLIWGLTGAFYPAIDLCAGEKERGTLETLLCSPARRSEIVWGKLLTVMLFSVLTVVLNLASVALTGAVVVAQVPEAVRGIGPPPPAAVFWVLLALLPVAALFSALCLALAAFARSSKEGQYYLMPLFLVALPLVILPMSPGVELSLGNSLIPVSGIVLLLRAAIEGDYAQAARYVLPVVFVTGVCVWLAVRWAVDQFNRETVLFREGERLQLGLWLRHLLRDRDQTPSVAAALLCAVLILLLKFFLGLSVSLRQASVPVMIVTVQLVAVLLPAGLMTVLFTSSPRKTLLLQLPRPAAVPMAVLLAVVLHPVVVAVAQVVETLYPLSPEMKQAARALLEQVPGGPRRLLLLALLPAVCEELAFRGFILSGLRHMGHRRLAIVLCAVLFGMIHAVVQQAIVAALVGVVLGYITVRSRSLLVPVLFHATHNALSLSHEQLAQLWQRLGGPQWLLRTAAEGELEFTAPVVLVSGLLAAAVLWWWRSQPVEPTPEEELLEALAHQEEPASAPA